MGDAPAVSVIVPCFNLGQYVGEAVDSVLSQTFADCEILVVNDGSTDPVTNRILASLNRPRTRVLSCEANQGLPAARNYAARYARGTYLCALDADDRLHPQFLEKTIAVLEREPKVAFVSTWAWCFGVENWLWRQSRCDFPALLAECVVLTAAPVRRAAFEAVGGYDCDRFLYGSEDWDLWISLIERGFSGTILPEALFFYRQRHESMRRRAEEPAVQERVWNTLVDKHRASYERFAAEVLLLQERDCGSLLLENWRLQYDITTRLKPLVEERRRKREPGRTVETDAADAAERLALERELQKAREEIAALRQSASWKLTGPIRAAYDALYAVSRSFRRGEGSNGRH